jgi:hypothetical protein
VARLAGIERTPLGVGDRGCGPLRADLCDVHMYVHGEDDLPAAPARVGPREIVLTEAFILMPKVAFRPIQILFKRYTSKVDRRETTSRRTYSFEYPGVISHGP